MALVDGIAAFFALFLIVLLHQSTGEHIRTIEDIGKLTDMQKTDVCVATLYIVDENVPKAFLSRLQKVQSQMTFYNIDVVQFECKSKSPRCPGETVVRLSKTEYFTEDFTIDMLHGKGAIIAHFLSFCLTEELPYTDELEEWNRLLAAQKGHHDVVLFFTEGYGTSSHRHLVEVSYSLRKRYQFTQTTEYNHPGVTGVIKNDDAALFYYKCREVKDKSEPCPFVKFEGKLWKKSDVITFLLKQDGDYENVTTMSEDVYTPLHDFMDHLLPLGLIYVFVGAEKIETTKEILKAVSRKTDHAVHLIVVDKEKYWKTTQRLGAFPPESSPTLVVELRNFLRVNQTFTEHWDNNIPFTEAQIIGFLDNLFETPAQFFANRAAKYGPRCLQVKTLKDHNVLIGTAVGTCGGGDACREFEKNFRRAVRTLYLAGETQLQIDYLDPITIPETEESESGPKLGYQAREDRFLKFEEDEVTYENILAFLVKSFSIHKVDPIPVSGSDLIPICTVKDQSRVRKNQVPEDLQSDEDDDSDENADLEDFNEESNAKLLETEEDQVARDFAAEHINKTFGPVKKSVFVKVLTDKSYAEMHQSRGVFLVHFYLPWDARSFNFHAVYEKVAAKLVEENGNKTGNIVLADVNCHDWPDVCQKANVTSYPLVKIFINGSASGFYNGLLGENALLKAARLYQLAYLTKLLSSQEISRFTDGTLRGTPFPPSTVSVLALLSSDTDVAMFSLIAKEFFGKAVFGYAEGEDAKDRAKSYGLEVPAIVVLCPFDKYNPVRLAPSFHREELVSVIKSSLLPTFGELTQDNFPDYHSLSRPYVILFKGESEKTSLLDKMTKIADTEITRRVCLTWMDVRKSVTVDVKKAYLGSTQGPAVVLVDHSKGSIYLYKEDQEPSLSKWINDCLEDKIRSQSSLRDGKWTPLREGYDYLRLSAENKMVNEMPKSEAAQDSEPKRSGRFQFTKKVEHSARGHDEL